jgi:hypothetical protein
MHRLTNNLVPVIVGTTLLSSGIGTVLYQHSCQTQYHDELSTRLKQFCKNKNSDIASNFESSLSTSRHIEVDDNLPKHEVTTVTTPVSSLVYSEELKFRPINFWIGKKRLKTFFGRECYNLFSTELPQRELHSAVKYIDENKLEFHCKSDRTFKFPSITRVEGMLSDEVINGKKSYVHTIKTERKNVQFTSKETCTMSFDTATGAIKGEVALTDICKK